jgi:zinc transporter ZupT
MATSFPIVFVAALGTALATGLGALPFLAVRDMSRRWLGVCNGIAGGFMLGASTGLVTEGANYGTWRVLAGVVVGIVAIWCSIQLVERLSHGEDLIMTMREGMQRRRNGGTAKVEDPEAAERARLRRSALRGVVIVALMTIHSFSEGVGIGVAYGGGESLGWLIAVAMALHNIPEGLAISLVLVPRGASAWQAARWSIFSSLPQPVMAVPAYYFVEQFQVLLPYGLGFAAGAMVWITIADLLPDALRDSGPRTVVASASLSIVAMLLFQAIVLGA